MGHSGSPGGAQIHPLTLERWTDFETLFGPHGASGGCWCMWWRVTRREFESQKGEANRRAIKAIVMEQKVFFVATAPAKGRINLSPKGIDAVPRGCPLTADGDTVVAPSPAPRYTWGADR